MNLTNKWITSGQLRLGLLMVCAGFLLAACNGGRQAESTVSAIETGEKARMEWQKARKSLAIRIENTDGGIPAWPDIGVCVDARSSLPEEREAFVGTVFVRKGGVYVPSDRNAMISDTAARISVCHPVRKGIAADGTVLQAAPFSENLYGVETGRSIGNAIQIGIRLQSAMALLRIAPESNDLRDRLDGLDIIGERIFTQGSYQPYTGKWYEGKADGGIRKQTDCLLNNGRNHDFYLIPTGTASPVTIGARINGRLHAVRTTLPPMSSGCLVHLSLRKEKDGLAISGSWVETERPLAHPISQTQVDSVSVGHFLQADGTLQAEKDSLSVAVVVETDGRHGKAVSLADCEGYYVFSEDGNQSGKPFATLDGTHREGILNPAEGIKVEDAVFYKPGMPYPEDCALGYADGASLTQRLLEAQRGTLEKPASLYGRRPMLKETRRHPGSYVPSLAEMAWLFYRLECDKDFRRQVRLVPPEGEYLTSSESGEKTFYRIDFTYGIMTGQLSKRFAGGKLRLFYLF